MQIGAHSQWITHSRTRSQVSYHIPAATSPSCLYVISNDALSLPAPVTVRRAKEREYQTLAGCSSQVTSLLQRVPHSLSYLSDKATNSNSMFQRQSHWLLLLTMLKTYHISIHLYVYVKKPPSEWSSFLGEEVFAPFPFSVYLSSGSCGLIWNHCLLRLLQSPGRQAGRQAGIKAFQALSGCTV